jgi:hypothetical protein
MKRVATMQVVSTNSTAQTGRPRRGRAVRYAVCAVLLLSSTPSGQGGSSLPKPAVPWVEARAPEAFTSDQPGSQPHVTAKYRIDADVLLPLGVGSIRLTTRRDAGSAALLVKEYGARTGETIRAYEFVAFSVPERAHRIDRLGFFWEAQATTPQGANWTAYFGGVTLSREKTADEMQQQSFRYEVIDGLTTEREAIATIYRVPSGPRRTSPLDLYSQMRPFLQTSKPHRSHRIVNQRLQSTAAFLGAIDATLQAVVFRHAQPPLKESFVYGAQKRSLELLAIERDADAGRTFAESGWKGDPEIVHALTYRTIAESTNVAAEFRIWIDVPKAPPPISESTPAVAVPIAFEVRPRAFLRLRFTRTG